MVDGRAPRTCDAQDNRCRRYFGYGSAASLWRAGGHARESLRHGCGADFGFAMSLVNTHNIALRLCKIAPDILRDRYVPALLRGEMTACAALTGLGTGSDFSAITTTATPTMNGWLLNGEKTWIINGRHAGLSIVYAQCKAVGDSYGIGAFLVDLNTQGVTRYAIDAGFSQANMGTGGFVLKKLSRMKLC